MKKILVEYSGFVGSNICMKEKFYELQDNGFYKFKDNVSKQEKNTDNKEAYDNSKCCSYRFIRQILLIKMKPFIKRI